MLHLLGALAVLAIDVAMLLIGGTLTLLAQRVRRWPRFQTGS
ncbi:MAG TPA: hypothetical protein VGM91_03365 [Conexibacter sp.]|jgi:hypothetical protein